MSSSDASSCFSCSEKRPVNVSSQPNTRESLMSESREIRESCSKRLSEPKLTPDRCASALWERCSYLRRLRMRCEMSRAMASGVSRDAAAAPSGASTALNTAEGTWVSPSALCVFSTLANILTLWRVYTAFAVLFKYVIANILANVWYILLLFIHKSSKSS